MRVSLTGKDNNRFDDLSKMIGELSVSCLHKMMTFINEINVMSSINQMQI